VHTRLPLLIEEYGLESAVELCEFEDVHVPVLTELIKKEEIECDFRLSRSYDIYTDREEARKVKEAYLKLKSEGVAKRTMEDLVWTDEENAEKVGLSLLNFGDYAHIS
jgi:hypothetical protein